MYQEVFADRHKLQSRSVHNYVILKSRGNLIIITRNKKKEQAQQDTKTRRIWVEIK